MSWKKLHFAVVVLFLVSVGVIGGSFGIVRVGQWLVVADPLEDARAIVVMSGQLPFRAMEAASIYRQGWAPEVWITKAWLPAEEAALAKLGIQVVGEEAYNRRALEILGVPTKAIRLLPKRIQNTAEEVELIAHRLEEVGGDRVILVTSKPHTRRVRAIWKALVRGGPQGIVRYATEDPFDPGRWWRNTKDALAVSREIFGLMNVWAGFPVKPDRQ